MSWDGCITLHHQPDGSAYVLRPEVEASDVPGLAEQMDTVYPYDPLLDAWVIPAEFLDMARALDARRKRRLH